MAKSARVKKSKENTFEIGLVMAGAVSAGAYTAGVIDFLIEALDQWYTAKENKQLDCPPHNVKIRVMSGASAGAMTAGITAAALGGVIEPVREIRPWKPVNNKLYESWVQRIGIEHLLGKNDLKSGEEPVKSIFDSTVLDEIAADAFSISPIDTKRKYIADPLEIFLSVTNLRGVPYNIGFQGATEVGHELSMRADYIHFSLTEKKTNGKGGRRLDPKNYNDPVWHELAEASLASGAFPVGLAPRILSRDIDEYAKRMWQIPLDRQEREQTGECFKPEPIKPAWPDEIKKQDHYTYDFVSVDGGVLDNEPLELARKTLAQKNIRNERNGTEAKRAVILIDPFPHDAPFALDYDKRSDIAGILPALLSSLRHQSRFKPDELILAQKEDIYSRFLIAPKRKWENGDPAEHPIASGILGGFGGFLSLAFREHDYQLGRRNCQLFLKEHFALPYSASGRNSLFDKWSGKMVDRHLIKDKKGVYLPIIPLMGGAVEEVPAVPWPSYTQENLKKLRPLLKKRVVAVASRLVDMHIPYWPVRAGVKLLLKTVISPRIVKAAISKIGDDARKYKFG